MRLEIRGAWRTRSSPKHAPTALYLGEYMTRKSLRGLGFVDNLENVDCITAEAMAVIDAIVEEIKAEEMKRASARKG